MVLCRKAGTDHCCSGEDFSSTKPPLNPFRNISILLINFAYIKVTLHLDICFIFFLLDLNLDLKDFNNYTARIALNRKILI